MLSLGACSGLPKGGESAPSTAMKGNGGTALVAAVRLRVAAHPGQSGLHALPDGRDALAARLALADAAQRSLDVQYFIWNKDLAGKVLLEHLFRAADRGVRVRLLLDDLGTMPSDITLLTIDSHPIIRGADVQLLELNRVSTPVRFPFSPQGRPNRLPGSRHVG
jgi:cardiolipin synthase C